MKQFIFVVGLCWAITGVVGCIEDKPPAPPPDEIIVTVLK